MGSEEESIEQTVASRRERLAALRAAQELSNAPEAGTEPESAAANGNDDRDESPQEEQEYAVAVAISLIF